MEQGDVLEVETKLGELFCLPELSETRDREDTQVFRLVVETANYRIEIEIG